jgi:hypothetical protein
VTIDPEATFDQLGVDAVVTGAGHPLAFWLASNPGWRVIGTDPVAVAAVRNGVSCAAA